MKEYIILEEEEVAKLLSPTLARSAIERCFKEKSANKFVALPKINIKGQNGSLRITPGESYEEFEAIGFRLYDVIREDFSKQPQPIIVYNNKTGQLKGIVLSQLLGAYRTAAINAVMQNYFNEGRIESMGLIGTGFQARIHLEMFVEVLKPSRIRVYGRTDSNVIQFIKEMKAKLDIQIERCMDINELASERVLLLTTRSKHSLLDASIFKGEKIITTIGPKIRGNSEVSNAFAESCDLIVTDSIEQVEKYGNDFFIENLSLVKDFADVLKVEKKQVLKNKRVLLCSVGMGGTEVALANELIELKLKQKGVIE